MHNTVREKQKIFKQLCHFCNTNSELLPASAYKASILAVVRRSTLTISAAIFLRLKARDSIVNAFLAYRTFSYPEPGSLVLVHYLYKVI